jgi:chromosome segregation protein
MRTERDDLRGRIREGGARIAQERDELDRLRGDLQEVERNHIMKKEQCSLLMKSLDDTENSRVSILSKLEETKLALEMQQEVEETSETARLEAELSEFNAKRSEIEAALTDKKVAIASLEGKLEKKEEEIRGLHEMQTQFNVVVEQRTAEIESSNEEIVVLDADVEKERAHVTELLETERSYEVQIDALAGDMEEKRTRIGEMERELKAKQSERNEIISKQNEIKITLSTIETRMKDMIDRGIEVFKEDLSCYLAGEELPLTEEESAVTGEMLENEKRKLEGLGAVNLAAVEEFEEKKERFDFLTGQKEDLEKAKGELEEAIRKINRRARKKFLETFEVVARNFTSTFGVLFEGGEASLTLEEGTDPLEAEIIINATPKGKRLQDISLLSGGERALTALALLFALYKAKPSPFCIFDEVDAPLDDANIQRFIRMLNTFQDDTQFIIITHNKRTMEVAHTLYGVTMEQRGISSIVSVDMSGIERVLGEKEAPAEELAEVPVSTN